jgi:hypothetical protein
MPAYLHKVGGLDPMEIGLKKAGMVPKYIDQLLIENAKDSFRPILFHKTALKNQRVLTDEEAVAGIEGDEFLGPINRRSSAGFGWSKKRERGKLGKSQWLGTDQEYKLSDDVRDNMAQYTEMASIGIRKPTVFVDTLKDERRPILKVEAGKTRIFAAGPMDYILVMRKYFLGFMAHVMENRIDNEICVGVNPFGHDWTRLGKALSEQGDLVFAGDFSNFDGTLNPQILIACLDLIQEWYGDDHYLLRYTLFQEIVHSVHINGKDIYMWTHSQPSGNPLTAVLNSLYNCLSMRICWQLLTEGTEFNVLDYNKYVKLVAYGDDNVGNVSLTVSDFFNQETITRAYHEIGMTYTDEAKTGNIVKFRKLHEISFLKRKFVKNNEGYGAPLDLATVLEMSNWIRGDLDQCESTLDNVSASIQELSLHPLEIFDHYRPLLVEACRRRCNRIPETYSYETYKLIGIDKKLF